MTCEVHEGALFTSVGKDSLSTKVLENTANEKEVRVKLILQKDHCELRVNFSWIRKTAYVGSDNI